MMTEDEARKKWCPMARGTWYIQGDGDVLVNAIGYGSNRVVCDVHEIHEQLMAAIEATKVTRCLASDCACWRWVTLCDGENTFPREKGYCGLAGVPR